MNKERLISFRNWFETNADEYSQWSCEKCIWGYARRWTKESYISSPEYFGGSVEMCAALFGLTYEQSGDVFTPEFKLGDDELEPEPTKTQALQMLDHLIKHGEVQWPAELEFTPRPSEEADGV